MAKGLMSVQQWALFEHFILAVQRQRKRKSAKHRLVLENPLLDNSECDTRHDLNPPALVTRIQAVKAESFQFQLQKEEAAGNTHASQPVNWVAFERGDGSAFDAARTAKVVTDADYDLSFDPVPIDEFVFLTAMQTRKGGDTAKVGLSDLSADGATVFIEEELSLDSETDHNAEIVAYLTASEGIWYS
ncbi:MAG: hypothetical protein AAGL66_18480 [Pseudomonadota bacterium]